MTLLARLYSRRIININVNIILAGVLALVPVAIVVNLIHQIAFHGRGELSSREHAIISGATLITDIISDVTFFYLLHWLANHAPSKFQGGKMVKLAEIAGEHAAPGYFKDATLVQIERMVLSPLLYAIWLAIQNILISQHVEPTRATVFGFLIATTLIRTAHTLWMLRAERKQRAKRARALFERERANAATPANHS
jgi:hypothetical protein